MSEHKYQTVSQIIAERDSLRAVNAELLEALEAIVSDRDKNASGPEKHIPKSSTSPVPYWSPSATMVHSEFIAAARAAIAKANALKGDSHEQS